VAEPPVVNASPLIFLSRAGLIYLLQLISSEIIVPEAVHAEIEIRGHSDPTAQKRQCIDLHRVDELMTGFAKT